MIRQLFGNVGRDRLPHLTLAQRVVDKIVQNALIYETETGESLVGLAVPGGERPEPDLYVLDTIAPDDTAIRSGAYFEQGDDLQGDIFNWLYDNWEAYRERQHGAGNGKWNRPLVHLGDWHKHPGKLVMPSLGDRDTAHDQIFDRGAKTPQILVVLATVWDKTEADATGQLDPDEVMELLEMAEVAGMTEEFELSGDLDARKADQDVGQPLKVTVDAHTVVRIDCWYMSRQVRRFARLTPTIIPDADLPALAPIGWHLVQHERMRMEVEALSREGFAVSVQQFDTNQQPPLDICFSLARRESENVLIVVTQVDYPEKMPMVRFTPISAMRRIAQDADLFAQLWRQSQPLPEGAYPTWRWSPDRMLVDLVIEIESRMTEGNKP